MKPAEILEAIRGKRALVVGDICLDRWCDYAPALGEPSRETGLSRVAVVRTRITAGAGGTVANNLAALGAKRVSVLGAVGDDGHGYELRQALAAAGIDSSLLVESPMPTFTYTKLLNQATGDEDLGRIDFLSPPPPEPVDREIVRRLETHAAEFDCLLVSDQAETETPGVVTESVRSVLSGTPAKSGAPVIWVDSRMRAELFRNVLVKPNEREAQEACRRLGLAHDDFRGLLAHIGHNRMIVTHGPRGALILDGEKTSWASTTPVDRPVDICGAGDSFSAGAALALAAGAPLMDAAIFGNLVTSITIMKKGTGTASPEEVMRAAMERGL